MRASILALILLWFTGLWGWYHFCVKPHTHITIPRENHTSLCIHLRNYIKTHHPQSPFPSNGSAIILLTGGKNRLTTAIDSLYCYPHVPLYISGVHPYVRKPHLYKNRSLDKRVHLDYKARNTTGNAKEVAKWVEDNQIRHIILITNALHMPRALTELKTQTPRSLKIIPYGIGAHHAFREWVFEYTKHLVSFVRSKIA
jgi:uncharacterized SAM-binding protein YcdF (DUF218 family)